MFFNFGKNKEKYYLDKLKKVFEVSKPYISAERYESCIELIEHNELGVALEILCANIEDNEFKIPNSLYLDIKEILENWHCVHNIDYYDIQIEEGHLN